VEVQAHLVQLEQAAAQAQVEVQVRLERLVQVEQQEHLDLQGLAVSAQGKYII